MKDVTEKFDLRIYYPGSDEPHIITSDVPFILPRVGELIDPHWFHDNLEIKFKAGNMLRVLRVTHMFLQNNLFLSHQQIRIETEMVSPEK